MTATATVTIPYNEFQELQEAKRAAEIEVSKLKEQITEKRIDASDPHLLLIATAAIDIVRYAVGSLPPESNRGWPFESLRMLADEIVHMPDATPDHNELAQTFKIFASECEAHERRRQLRDSVKQQSFRPELTIKNADPVPRELVAQSDQDP